MKAKISKLKLVSAIVATCFVAPAFAQLGGLKNAAKNAASKSLESKPKEEKKEDKKSSESNSKPVEVSKAGKSPDDIQIEYTNMGDEALSQKKYDLAIDYYQKAYDAWPESSAAKRGDFGGYKRKAESEREREKENQKADEDQANLLEKLKNMEYKCENMPVDNGISSPTHTKYLKKIVFSKTEIVKAQENEANFTNTFSLTDNIYSRVYLEKSIRNEAGNIGDCFNATYFIRYSFDDGATKMPEWVNVNVHNVLGGAEDAVDKWTTWQPAISWSAADLTSPETGVKYFIKFVRNLPVGTHKIKMEVVYDIPEDSNNGYSTKEYTTKFGPEKVLAVGEFNLNVTEEGKKALYKKVCPMYKTQIADYNRPAFTLVPNAVALAKTTTGVDWKKFTLLKIVGDADWTYKRNVYGVILSRSAKAGVYLLNNEDGFIYYSQASYGQENISSGGSSYGQTTVWVEEQNIEYTRNYDSFCKECIGK